MREAYRKQTRSGYLPPKSLSEQSPPERPLRLRFGPSDTPSAAATHLLLSRHPPCAGRPAPAAVLCRDICRHCPTRRGRRPLPAPAPPRDGDGDGGGVVAGVPVPTPRCSTQRRGAMLPGPACLQQIKFSPDEI